MTEKETLKFIDQYYNKLKKMNKEIHKPNLTNAMVESMWKNFQIEDYNFKELMRLELVSRLTDKNIQV